MASIEVLSALDRFGFYFFQCLISFLWQSSLILLPVLILLWILRRRSPVIRNIIVLTGFMTIPVILAYSWFLGMPGGTSHPLPVMPDYRASGRSIPSDGMNAGASGSLLPRERYSGTSAKLHERSGTKTVNGSLPGREHAVFAPFSSWKVFSYPWVLALTAYFLVQGYLVLKFLLEWWIVRWWIWRSRTVEDSAVCRVFWRAAFFLEVRTSQFGVMECPFLTMPVTVGTIAPRVILPAGFPSKCSPDDFRAVVYHEMAHVQRRDPLVLTFISFLRTLLFFHPLVQLAAREYTLIAEQASDAVVIEESGISPVSYARSLTRVAEILAPQALKSALALGIFRQRSFLFHRLELILSDSGHSHQRFRSLFSTAAIAGLALFLTVSISLPLVERDPGSVETTVLRESGVSPVVSLAPPYTACAIPVSNIRVDGDLSDWPKDMVRYSIPNRIPLSGIRGDARGTGPQMMVGYGPEDGLLYVAVTVPDERVVTMADPEWATPERTDACEVYVDGMHLARNAGEGRGALSAWDLPAQQYVMCPEGGAYDRGSWLHDPPYTPALFRGNIRQTGSMCASLRQGDVTTYEWAVRVYTRYPVQPLRLTPGRVLGFDAAVRDCDNPSELSTWNTWGPNSPAKVFDTSLLGDLVLAERYEDLGFVSGTVTRCRDPYADHTLHVYRGNEWVGEFTTDRSGRFRLMLPPGNYTVRSGESSEVDRFYLDTFTVVSGSLVKPRLHIAMNGFFRLRYETVAFFHKLTNPPAHTP